MEHVFAKRTCVRSNSAEPTPTVDTKSDAMETLARALTVPLTITAQEDKSAPRTTVLMLNAESAITVATSRSAAARKQEIHASMSIA